jgi:hypothetical protein
MEFYNETHSYYINQIFYGGADLGAKMSGGTVNNQRKGAYWKSLTDSSITVYRMPEDLYVEKIRIRIWPYNSPQYNSGWLTPTPGIPLTIEHNLGWPAENYLVCMDYKSAAQGIHQCYYGGNDFGTLSDSGTLENDRVGAFWLDLKDNSITVNRRAEDSLVENIRIRIWLLPKATYDSGWTTISKDATIIFNHGIEGSPSDYVVDIEYRNPTDGINQRYYGGLDMGTNPGAGTSADDRVGVYWMLLNGVSITVYRRPEDIYAPEVRVRIWNCWTPSAPDYDSWWRSVATDEDKMFKHHLGGSEDRFYVDMEYLTLSGYNINQQFYGGKDLGSKSYGDSFNNARVGAYWYSLDDESFMIYRRAEDFIADQVRIRIWEMPKPDYDSDWFDITAGGASATLLTHNLRGDTFSYLVDLQYKSSALGINQCMYGGNDLGNKPPSMMNENDRMGAYWSNLNGQYISVYRRAEDMYAPQVRVRIWRMNTPDYRTSNLSLGQGGTQTLNHLLKGNPAHYLVNMIQYDPDTYIINQKSYGGQDMGTKSSGEGYSDNDRAGCYWFGLTQNKIDITRRSEDTEADYFNIRIWRIPPNIPISSIIDHLLGLALLYPPGIYEADTNGDGKINIADVVFLIKAFKGTDWDYNIMP